MTTPHVTEVARHGATDARIAAAPNFAAAMQQFEAALAAGVPIADLIAAQTARLHAR